MATADVNKKNPQEELEEINNLLGRYSLLTESAMQKGQRDKAQQFLAKKKELLAEAERIQVSLDTQQDQVAGQELSQTTNAAESLARGDYKEKSYFAPSKYAPAMPSTSVASKSKQEKNLKRDIGTYLGVDPKKVDTSGLPAEDKIKLAALNQPESKIEYLVNKYGGENLFDINLDGKNRFVVRRGDGSFLLSGRGEVEPTDTLSLGTEVAPTIAGAITIGKTGSPLAASGAYAGVGATQDMLMQYLAGVEVTPKRVAGQRLTEAALTYPIDLATAGTAKFLSRRIGEDMFNRYANELTRAKDVLTSRMSASEAAKVSLPKTIEFGPRAVAGERILAGMSPEKGFSRKMRRTQEALAGEWEKFLGEVPGEPTALTQTASDVLKQRSDLVDLLSFETRQPKRVIEGYLDSKISGFKKSEFNKTELGNGLTSLAGEFEQKAISIKNDSYDELFRSADSAGLSTDPNALRSLIRQFRIESYPKENPAVKKVESALTRRILGGKRLSVLQGIIDKGKELTQFQKEAYQELMQTTGPISANELDTYIRIIKDAAPAPGQVAGAGTQAEVASEVSNKLSKWRDELYDDAGLTDLRQKAITDYDARMAFERGTPGQILKEVLGEQVKTPYDVVDLVLKEPTTINRVVGSLKQYATTPKQKQAFDKAIFGLQQAYIEKTLGTGYLPSRVNFDVGVVRALWGESGDRMVKSLSGVNNALAKSKLDTNLTMDDVNQLYGALDQDSINSVTQSIIARKTYEQGIEKLTNSQIYKLAKESGFEKVDPDSLSQFILSPNTTITQTRDVWKSLNAEDKNLYKADFTRALLNKYPSAGFTSNKPYIRFFDSERFLKDVNGLDDFGDRIPSDLRNKLEVVLGKEQADYIESFARVLESTTPIAKKDNETIRATMGLGGVSVYMAQGVTKPVRNWLMAGALSSGAMEKSGIIRFIAKDSGVEATEQAYKNMMKNLFTTRSGLTSLYTQAAEDEEFAQYLSELNQGMKSDEEMLKQMKSE
jgi:hypothetical protein